MKTKNLIRPDRRRRLPDRFSWIDQRLVKDGHFQSCSHGALALYLFLLTVADADGLSYYGTEKMCGYLNCNSPSLKSFREELTEAGLIAYDSPFYQILELNPESFDRTIIREALRSAVRHSTSSHKKKGLVDMYSPHYKKPDDWRPVQKLGNVINDIMEDE